MSCWVSSSERSIAFSLSNRAGLLALAPAHADTPRHDDPLDVGGRAGMQRRYRVALNVFDRALQRSPALGLGKHPGTCDAQHAIGVVEPRELAPQAVL